MFTNPDRAGTTPVAANEERYLRISVRTVEELNLHERANIERARRWLFSPRIKLTPDRLLDHLFVREIHRRMFSTVWRWAGKIRDCDLQNIGVPVHDAETRLYSVMEDGRAWITYGTYDVDELCVRLHHGLVVVHPWRNGNGRHARLVADRLAVLLDRPAFTWGGGAHLEAKSSTRDNYLASLR